MWGKADLVTGARVLFAAGLSVLVIGCSDDSSGDGDEADASEPGLVADVPGEGVASPAVSGPVTGGEHGVPFNPLPAGLADDYGYVEDEYFIEGEAAAYVPVEGSSWELDGVWEAAEADQAGYTTRIVVRRPADPGDFNGTVMVEWLNVTAGMDADPDFGFTHELLLEEGWAYVGVSAQIGGIEGEGGLEIEVPGFEAEPLKEWDPVRYGELHHPGDIYSYDIFSQAAQVIRRPAGIDPLEGLEPTTVLAVGESQAAMRLTTYVNAVHPLASIYDGFLIHSRGGSGTPLLDDPEQDPVPSIAHVRTDLEAPVFQFATETDLFVLGFHEARQEDSVSVRTWEVAGTAHADQATVDYGVESGRQWDTTTEIDFSDTCGQLNDGPQGPVLRAAVSALRDWVTVGSPPPEAEPLEIVTGEDGPAIARDDHGNALGGVRTPAVEAPVATLTGDSPDDSEIFCILFGQTVPFDDDTLAELYPTPEDYASAVEAAAAEAVEAGFLLEQDAAVIVAAAD